MNAPLPWVKDEEFERLVVEAKSAPIKQIGERGSFTLNCISFIFTLVVTFCGLMFPLPVFVVVGFYFALRKNALSQQVGVSILAASQISIIIVVLGLFYLSR